MVQVVESLLAILASAGGIAIWFFSIYRASIDPALQPQARKVASLALLFAPFLILLYWLPKALGKGPFGIHFAGSEVQSEDERRDRRVPARD